MLKNYYVLIKIIIICFNKNYYMFIKKNNLL